MSARPWTPVALTGVVVGQAVGLVAIVVAWYAVSGRSTPGPQTPWVAAGVTGLIVAGLANAAWLAGARRAIAVRRVGVIAGASAAADRRRARPAYAPRPVAAAGARLYHRPECPLVAGRSTTAATAAAHTRAGRRPCGVCGV